LSRRLVVVAASAVCFLLGIPASLSFGVMSDVTVFGKNWFDLVDFLSNSVLLPIGGLFTALFVGWFWAKPALRALSNEGELSQPWAGAWLFILRFVAPIAIAWILISALKG